MWVIDPVQGFIAWRREVHGLVLLLEWVNHQQSSSQEYLWIELLRLLKMVSLLLHEPSPFVHLEKVIFIPQFTRAARAPFTFLIPRIYVDVE